VALSEATEAAHPANPHCRTWLLHGDSDPFCSEANLDAVRRALGETDVQSTSLFGTGHWPAQEASESTMQMIERMLEALSTTAIEQRDAESVE
jgi:pimeloyl-ACP methyl ester carboxylesterase